MAHTASEIKNRRVPISREKVRQIEVVASKGKARVSGVEFRKMSCVLVKTLCGLHVSPHFHLSPTKRAPNYRALANTAKICDRSLALIIVSVKIATIRLSPIAIGRTELIHGS